ncbi:LytR C-terminal domain-containing protein [Actinoplanes sp. NPDC049681]|uniref:LytR C-terminal domain-containing protein n=1 Tax=Actinoplanes sp. NPDC049681 TaxID=3363905 RepID=UPI003794C4F7
MSFTRVRAFIVVGFLAVAAIVTVVIAVVRDTQADAVAAGCPAGAPIADLRLPKGPKEVTVKVLNGTRTQGRARDVSAEFANREFKVEKPGENKKHFDEVALLRYGPAAVGDAQLIQAYFLGDATRAYDPKRKGAVVDVVIGERYRQLGTTTEVKQSLGILGEAQLPPGACAAKA